MRMPPFSRPTRRAGALLTTCLAAGLTVAGPGQGDIRIAIEGSGFEKIPIAIPDFPAPAPGDRAAASAALVRDVIWDDLAFSGYFDLVDRARYRLVPGFSERDVHPREWLSIGARAVFLGRLEAGDDLSVEGRLYDTGGEGNAAGGAAQLIFGKRYTGSEDLARRIGHKLANDITRSMTGSDGIFLTKIAFTRETGPRRKEIMVMDFDGNRVSRVTANGSINLTPAWSPDGRRLAYVTFVTGRPEIHLVDADGTRSQVFAREGDLNSAPEWAPDGSAIVYSASRDGNTELLRIDLGNNRITRLTNNPAIDTSPAFSPNGREIAFTSDRTGTPQIWVMDAEGANVRRVTVEGSYNESAAWSPRGTSLAYISRIDGRFDIMLRDLAAGTTRRLTHGEGNNENPRFSPDGMHLVFASNRSGPYQIFTMDLDGGNLRPLTRGDNCQTPDWSR
jgi:TolB protein